MAKQVAAPLMVVDLMWGAGRRPTLASTPRAMPLSKTARAQPMTGGPAKDKAKEPRARKKSAATRNTTSSLRVPVAISTTGMEATLRRFRVAKRLPFTGKMTMKIDSKVGLRRNWSLKPRTKIDHTSSFKTVLSGGPDSKASKRE